MWRTPFPSSMVKLLEMETDPDHIQLMGTLLQLMDRYSCSFKVVILPKVSTTTHLVNSDEASTQNQFHQMEKLECKLWSFGGQEASNKLGDRWNRVRDRLRCHWFSVYPMCDSKLDRSSFFFQVAFLLKFLLWNI